VGERVKELQTMKLQDSPSFRKVPIALYSSGLFRFTLAFAMALALCFGVIGIDLALEREEYGRHYWLPFLLALSSAAVLIANLIRILARLVGGRAEEE
jgi:hypothetical protein